MIHRRLAGRWFAAVLCAIAFFALGSNSAYAQESTPSPLPEKRAASSETAKPVESKGKESEANPASKKDLSAEAKEDDPLAGHSNHGEAFDGGPRQAAYVMGGTGDVHLAVTTKNELVQKLFNQGIGQLHGFWTFEAERSFRQAAALDPDCAMAYWGMAMANFRNKKRHDGFMAEAVKRKSKAGRREQLWIDAFNKYFSSTKKGKDRWKPLIKALEEIQYEFPEEVEAKAFLAWVLYTAKGEHPFNSYLAVDAIIGEVLDKNPMHPVHHYRIHLWDYEKPQRALKSAALCGQSAPTIAHMWHMPGHTYWRVKRYHDSAWQQEASARADHANMMRDRVLPYQIGNYAHNNEWLCRSLMYVGRARDAVSLASNMIELPQHPKLNNFNNRGSGAYYGRLRLTQALYDYELWDEIIALSQTSILEPTEKQSEQLKRLKLLGAAYFDRGSDGDMDAGKKQITALEEMKKAAEEKAEKAASGAAEKAMKEKKNEKDVKKAAAAARKKLDGEIRSIDSAINELNGRLAMAEGRHEEGIKILAKINSIPKEHRSRFHLAAGETDKAVEVAKQAKDSGVSQVLPLVNYVYVLYAAGRTDEAHREFNQLRALAGGMDTDLAAFKRLAPLAKELGLPQDWREPRATPDDVGNRPELDALGPFRWGPVEAKPWALPTQDGTPISLDDYRGKPVLVIFYLGYGCLHCAAQLEKFAPMTPQFGETGIELVAISSDPVTDLKKSCENYKPNGEKVEEFPFPLVADPDLKVFKEYRCHDDFEKMPLHGTFLIDGDGLVRWQDVSYDPFMEPEFLLKEAKRLLNQKPKAAERTAAKR